MDLLNLSNNDSEDLTICNIKEKEHKPTKVASSIADKVYDKYSSKSRPSYQVINKDMFKSISKIGEKKNRSNLSIKGKTDSAKKRVTFECERKNISDFNSFIFVETPRTDTINVSKKSQKKEDSDPQKYRRRNWEERVNRNPEIVIQEFKRTVPKNSQNQDIRRSTFHDRRQYENYDYSFINTKRSKIAEKLSKLDPEEERNNYDELEGYRTTINSHKRYEPIKAFRGKKKIYIRLQHTYSHRRFNQTSK